MNKILKSLAAIVAVGAVAGGATFAYFTSTQTSNYNTIKAGTLALAVNDNGGAERFNINLASLQNMAPGEKSGPATIKVHNKGSLNAATFGRFTLNDETETSLAKAINFYDYEVKYYEANGTPKSRVDTFIENGVITNSAFNATNINLFNWATGNGALDIPGVPWDMEGMKPGEYYIITFSLEMDPDANNTFQGKSLGFGYEVKATQVVKEAVEELNLGGNMDTSIDAHMTYLKTQVGL